MIKLMIQQKIDAYDEKEKNNQDKRKREQLKHQEAFSGGYATPKQNGFTKRI